MQQITAPFLRDQRKFLTSVRNVAGIMAPELASRFNELKRGKDYKTGNLYLTEFKILAETLTRKTEEGEIRKRDYWRKDLNLAGDEEEISLFCEAKSRQCARLAIEYQDLELQDYLLNLLDSYGVEITEKEREKINTRSMLLRLQDAKWWRGKIKKIAFRECEQIFRLLGDTRRSRGCYVSDFTLRRYISRERANRNLLDNLEATNEKSETFTLAELSALNISNPVLRRGELMVRMRGFEEWAANDEREWVPMFYTITCPSKYHIYSGERKNEKYKGFTVRDCQHYLNGVWGRVRAKAAREDIKYFGFRVAEPHHDGTPHWHLLLFVESGRRMEFTRIIKAGALAEDGHESGASKHRFEDVEITPEKGTAAGYVAKYVSKNIDGFEVGEDYEAQSDAVESAARVRAWASCWGIRQFQQIGGPPVTVYRELRRLARHPERLPVEGSTCGTPEQLALALESADSGDWQGYCENMGGAVLPRCARPISLCQLVRLRLNQYGEEVKYVAGLWCHWFVFPLRTRIHEWTVKLKNTGARRIIAGKRDLFFSGANAPPWTCVNNCTE